MNKLSRVKEALDNIIKVDECQPVDYIKDHEFAIKLIKIQQSQAIAALKELQEYTDRLESDGLLDDAAKAIFAIDNDVGVIHGFNQSQIDINYTKKAKAVINVIKGGEDE